MKFACFRGLLHWLGLPEDIRNARNAQYEKQFAQIFGAGRDFEKDEVGCTIAELDGKLPDFFARANLETPQDQVWA
ncbi:hypothetical protein [Methylobacterium mesophilicum]